MHECLYVSENLDKVSLCCRAESLPFPPYEMAKALRVSRLCIITGVISCIFYFQVSGFTQILASEVQTTMLAYLLAFSSKIMHAR